MLDELVYVRIWLRMRIDDPQVIVSLQQRRDDWRHQAAVVRVLRYAVNDLYQRQGEIQQHRNLIATADRSRSRRAADTDTTSGPLSCTGSRIRRRRRRS